MARLDSLDKLDQLEKEVAELPNSAYKVLLEYEIKSIRLLLEDIEKHENKKEINHENQN